MKKIKDLLKLIWTELTRKKTWAEQVEEEARRDGQLGNWE